MKRALKVIGIIFMVLIVAIGARMGYVSYSISNKHGLNALIGVIRSSSQFKVWEGLPHPVWERELFAEEARKAHSSHRGHLFYEGRIEL